MKKLALNYLKNLTFLKLSRLLFYAFIFLLPFQINVVVYASPLFESGNFNPFTSVFVHLTDIVFLSAFICWGISLFRNEYKEKIIYGNTFIFILLFLFLIIAQVSVFFAQDQWLAFNLVIRFVELALIYLFTVNKVINLKTIINVFIVTVSVQAVIAILQYINQGSIGLQFLGEPNIAPDIYGVAKVNLENNVLIRPYGTFPHPNILAGYLFAAMLFTFNHVRNKEYIGFPLLFLQTAAFVLAFSRGAFLALLVAFLVYISIKEIKISFKYILLILALLGFFVVVFNLEQIILERFMFADTNSLTERVFYYNISKQIIYNNPFGIGLGNFTLLMPDFTIFKLDPWHYQPVHNIYMLITNELGIHGFTVFITLLGSFAVLLFMKMKKLATKQKHFGVILLSVFSGIFVIGLFDHYLISLYHGQVLLFLLFAIYGKYFTLSRI